MADQEDAKDAFGELRRLRGEELGQHKADQTLHRVGNQSYTGQEEAKKQTDTCNSDNTIWPLQEMDMCDIDAASDPTSLASSTTGDLKPEVGNA